MISSFASYLQNTRGTSSSKGADTSSSCDVRPQAFSEICSCCCRAASLVRRSPIAFVLHASVTSATFFIYFEIPGCTGRCESCMLGEIFYFIDARDRFALVYRWISAWDRCRLLSGIPGLEENEVLFVIRNELPESFRTDLLARSCQGLPYRERGELYVRGLLQ